MENRVCRLIDSLEGKSYLNGPLCGPRTGPYWETKRGGLQQNTYCNILMAFKTYQVRLGYVRLG